MTDARIGWGGELQVSTSSSVNGLVEISEVREVTFPTEEADEHDVTHLKSPDRRKEFILGLIDGGMLEATLNYVPGGASDLLLAAARDDQQPRAVRIIIPGVTGAAAWQHTLSGLVKRYMPNAMTPGEPMTAALAIRITGAHSEGAETNEADS